jgi:chemotaxis protein methyltransferase CheR
MKTARLPVIEVPSDSQKFLSKLQADGAGYDHLAQLLKSVAGIHMLRNDKNLTLMASRLLPILRDRGIESYRKYFEILKKEDPNDIREFIQALTTNTTQFFRESVHFDIFRQKVTEMIEAKKKSHTHEFRLWCSATSTGQEVYTTLMVLQSAIEQLNNWKVHFLATDIDLEVLQTAATGIYSSQEMNGIPDLHRQRFFHPLSDGVQKRYQVKREFREMVRFAQFNLLEASFPFKHKFDFAFCRNVLIYFDRPTAEAVIEKIALTLAPGGFLFLGHSETGLVRTKLLKSIATGAYLRVGE